MKPNQRARVDARLFLAERAIRERSPVFLLAALVTYNLLFWIGWYGLFGPLTLRNGFGAFAAFLILLRLGWPILDQLLPGD